MDLISIDSGQCGGFCDAYDSGESVMVAYITWKLSCVTCVLAPVGADK